MVAAIITKNHAMTDITFDFAFSFDSALTGNTNIRPTHTITPIATTLVTIWTLRMIFAVIVRKSEPESVTLRSIFASDWVQMLGLQFLNSSRISPPLYTHSTA